MEWLKNRTFPTDSNIELNFRFYIKKNENHSSDSFSKKINLFFLIGIILNS